MVPSVTFPQAGTATVSLESFSMNLLGRNAAGEPARLPPVGTRPDSDYDPDTFDVYCVLSPASQSKVLRTMRIIQTVPPTPLPSPIVS